VNILRFSFAYLRKGFLQGLSYRTAFFTSLFGIVVPCILYYYLSKIVDTADTQYTSGFGGEYFPYFILGMGVYRFTQHVLVHFVGTLSGEAVNGTLEALWLGRFPPLALIFSMALGPFLGGLVRLAGFIVVGGILSPSVFQKISVSALLVSILLSFLLYVSIGLIVISVTLVTKRGQGIIGLFGSLNLLLTGVFFPATLFPKFIQPITELLPLTHILRLARAGIYGIGEAFLFECGYFILFALLMIPLSLFCLKRAVVKVEIDGSLAHF